MAIERANVMVRLPTTTFEVMSRLCVFMERSQAKLIDILILQAENDWLAKMTQAEQKAYKAGELRLEDWRHAYAKKRA